MTLIPLIQILFFANQFQCISRVNIHPKTHGNYQTTLDPSHFPFWLKYAQAIFNLIPYTSISLIPNQFQHVIQNALSNPNHHSLYFSNPNLIHFFLNLFQNHHDSTLNTTNLTSIQENQGISHEKHKNQLSHQWKLTCFLVFPWLFFLDSTWISLGKLEGEENHIPPCSTLSHMFFFPSFSFLSFLFSLFFSLFPFMAELPSFEQTQLLEFTF